MLLLAIITGARIILGTYNKYKRYPKNKIPYPWEIKDEEFEYQCEYKYTIGYIKR